MARVPKVEKGSLAGSGLGHGERGGAGWLGKEVAGRGIALRRRYLVRISLLEAVTRRR